MVWSTEKTVKNTTYLLQWQTTIKIWKLLINLLHASMHMILPKVLQVISPLSWNCHPKWLHRQQKILCWNLSHSWECKPISIRTEAHLQKTRMSWCLSIQHFMMNIPATSPASAPSRLCLGNKLIRTIEKVSTLRVWCPTHKAILQTTNVWRNTITWKKWLWFF